jgi:hypothetical protein
MLIVLSITTVILAFFILLGYPLVSIFFNNKYELLNKNSILVITLSLLIGYGISGFAAATAYGITGINTYVYVLVFFLFINWLIYFVKNEFKLKWIGKFNISDIYLLIPITISIWVSSSQWTGLFKPVVKVGPGPDVAQNLMAAQTAASLGNTWTNSLNGIKEFLEVNTTNLAALKMFEVPSSSSVAGYDYLVFGMRWGLSVPYNQLMRLLGPQSILYETGVVLLISLISFALIFFSIGKIFTNKVIPQVVIATVSVANSTLLLQYLNGGLSQIFGSIGISGLLLVVLLLFKTKEIESNKNIYVGLFLIATFAWIGAIVSYIDSVFILSFVLLIVGASLILVKSRIWKPFFAIIFGSGVISILATPIAIIANLEIFNLRRQAALGTGTSDKVWQNISVLLGLFNPMSSITNNIFLMFIPSLLIILVFLYALIKDRQQLELAILGLSGLSVVFFGFIISYTGRAKTTYIYEKISAYLSGLVLVTLILLIIGLQDSLKKSKIFSKSTIYITIIGLLTVFSSASFQSNYFKPLYTTVIPAEIGDILNDKKAQNTLNSHNYLMPYKASYNYAAVLGAEYWISKAPNDFKMTTRINNDLRLFCFTGDPECKPSTPKISDPNLEKYGIEQFESPFTTLKFMELSINDRFTQNFLVFGMQPQYVSEKYKGGNPYFK